MQLSNMDTKYRQPDPGVAETSDYASESPETPNITAGSQHLHRKLGGKEVQLFAVGGAIGTCTCRHAGGIEEPRPQTPD